MKSLFRVLGLILIIVTFLSAIGLIIWQWNIKDIYTNQNHEISNIIDSSIKKHSKNGLLLPDIILLKSDSISKEKLSDSLTSEIKQYMRERFLTNNSVTIENIDLKPYYVLPDKPNADGAYILTNRQLEELKSHIDFLTKQVSIEVTNTKEEVGKDIDRLNTWMSIWIAVIGFLGIFVPIVVNLDVIKSADKAETQANQARKNANEAKTESETAKSVATNAITKIDAAQENIRKVEGIEKKVDEIEPRVDKAVVEANKALTESKETRKGLELVHSINRLNKIEASLLLKLKGKHEKIQFISHVLKKLHEALDNSRENFDNSFTKDLLIQLIDKLRKISYFKFINASQTKDFNELAEQIEKALDNFDDTAYKGILISLEELIQKLEGK